MINIKIEMADNTEYNIRNSAQNIKDAYKNIVAPYGTNMSFVEILPGTLISVANIVCIRELTDAEVEALKEPKEVTGLTETEVIIKEEETEESMPDED